MRSDQGQSSPPQTNTKPKITRSRLGCLTCRRRRKACDQKRLPGCETCQRLGLTCVWPSPSAVASKPTLSNSKRPLERLTPLRLGRTHPSSAQPPEGVESSLPAPRQNGLQSSGPLPGSSNFISSNEVLRNVELSPSPNRDGANVTGLPTPLNLTGSDTQGPVDRQGVGQDGSLTQSDGYDPSPSSSSWTQLVTPTQVNHQTAAMTQNALTDLPQDIEFTFQSWAAECLWLTAQQPYFTLSDFTSQAESSHDHSNTNVPRQARSVGGCSRVSRRGNRTINDRIRDGMDILRTPTALAEGDRRCNDHPFDDHRFLQHFIAVLSNLISCSGPGQSGNGFTAFAKLAGLPSQLLSHEEGESVPSRTSSYFPRDVHDGSENPSDPPRQPEISAAATTPALAALQLSILAWASKHMVNQGEDRYESTSERSGSQASSELERLLKERRSRENREDASSSQIEDKEDLTLLAATLMVISFKITRGDIWGFSFFMEELRFLTGSLFKIDSHDTEPGSMKHHFFENVAYHDVFSSTSLLSEPVVPTGILSAYSLKSPQIVRTLTGLSLPLLLTIHQIGQLIRERRSRIKIARCDDDERTWKGTAARFSDEDLLTVIREAQKLEQDLVQEKERMALLVADQPHLAPHRYLHEVLRTTALLHLHSFIYGQSPQCLKIRLFVRQLLSLLEAMADENLPGYCSLHWALFITGLNATGEGHESSALDDRARIQQLYETFSDDFAFMNLGRSHRIIKEVWSRNQQGRIFVDWLDIVEEFDWELFLV